MLQPPTQKECKYLLCVGAYQCYVDNCKHVRRKDGVCEVFLLIYPVFPSVLQLLHVNISMVCECLFATEYYVPLVLTTGKQTKKQPSPAGPLMRHKCQ